MPAIKKGKKATEAAPRAVQPITKREEHVDEEVSTEEVSDVEEEAMKEEEEDAEDGAEYTIDEGGDTHVAAGKIAPLCEKKKKKLNFNRRGPPSEPPGTEAAQAGAQTAETALRLDLGSKAKVGRATPQNDNRRKAQTKAAGRPHAAL